LLFTYGKNTQNHRKRIDIEILWLSGKKSADPQKLMSADFAGWFFGCFHRFCGHHRIWVHRI